MGVIFISYRRSDSQDVTGRIYDRLVDKFEKSRVFKDVDDIPLGVSFPEHLQQMLGKAAIVLVVIGPNWIAATDSNGRRRLDDPNDIVRLEVECALRANVPVVPILVSNASMPSGAELPPSMRALAQRNGMAVRPDPDFHRDMDRLFSGIGHLEKLLSASVKSEREATPAVAVVPEKACISCTGCGSKLKVATTSLGKKMKCPKCATAFVAAIEKGDSELENSDFDLRLDDSELAPDEEETSTSVPFGAYTGSKPFIFVSYCHRDRAAVYPELERLRKKGFRIWYDAGIHPGKEWPEQIEDALSRAAFFVVFVSPRAMSSENVRNEINYALRRQKPFLAIRIEETELVKGMALQMEARQAIFRYEIDHSLYTRRLDACLPATLREN